MHACTHISSQLWTWPFSSAGNIASVVPASRAACLLGDMQLDINWWVAGWLMWLVGTDQFPYRIAMTNHAADRRRVELLKLAVIGARDFERGTATRYVQFSHVYSFAARKGGAWVGVFGSPWADRPIYFAGSMQEMIWLLEQYHPKAKPDVPCCRLAVVAIVVSLVVSLAAGLTLYL